MDILRRGLAKQQKSLRNLLQKGRGSSRGCIWCVCDGEGYGRGARGRGQGSSLWGHGRDYHEAIQVKMSFSHINIFPFLSPCFYLVLYIFVLVREKSSPLFHSSFSLFLFLSRFLSLSLRDYKNWKLSELTAV